MFKKYRGRERWFADHRILKSAPVWYQPHLHLTIESEYTKESILADADTWETSFSSMMNSYHGRLAFNEFLYQNLADEYLIFWHAVEVAKRETDKEKLRPLVTDLYKAFVKPGALFCINLDAQNVKLIETKMELEYLDMEDIYEGAQAHVEQILKSQFYPDFLKSETLRHFVRSLK